MTYNTNNGAVAWMMANLSSLVSNLPANCRKIGLNFYLHIFMCSNLTRVINWYAMKLWI